MATLVRGLLVVLAAVAVACGSTGGASDDEVTRALRGGGIGVTAAEGPAALMIRYVLAERYGLGPGNDVTFVDSSADSVVDQLVAGDFDAAAVSQTSAYAAGRRDGIEVLVDVSQEMRDFTGAPFAPSVLVSYGDVAAIHPGALAELDRLFDASRIYWQANRAPILDSVAAATGADSDYLDWWWRHYDLPFGDLSPDTQRGIVAVWQAAAALGDIDGYPDIAGMLFAPSAGEATPIPAGVRETISLAVLDDPARRAVLYAIENGLVASNAIDVNITYLPQSALTDAASTRQYDVVEAPSVTVAVGPSTGVDFVVLSAALRDLSGTQIVVRRDR